MIDILMSGLYYVWTGVLIIMDALLFGMIVITLSIVKFTSSNFLKTKGRSFLILLIIILVGRWIY